MANGVQIIERIIKASMSLPRGDDDIWSGRKIAWQRTDTWFALLTAWLFPQLRRDWPRRLKPGVIRELADDDYDWERVVLQSALSVDVGWLFGRLGEALSPAIAEAFHGCRTEDAGVYFREGIRAHDRKEMITRMRSLVGAREELISLRNRIDKIVAEMDGTTDIGRVFLSLDARASIRDGSHYLLYGSEWMLGALGFSGHEVLRSIGVPTLLEVDLPLSWVHQAFRDALAQKLLAAWTRRICNDVDYIPIVDFTFIVHKSIPPDLVVGHSHPVVLRDPYSRASFRTGDPTCVHCRTITQR